MLGLVSKRKHFVIHTLSSGDLVVLHDVFSL